MRANSPFRSSFYWILHWYSHFDTHILPNSVFVLARGGRFDDNFRILFDYIKNADIAHILQHIGTEFSTLFMESKIFWYILWLWKCEISLGWVCADEAASSIPSITYLVVAYCAHTHTHKHKQHSAQTLILCTRIQF